MGTHTYRYEGDHHAPFAWLGQGDRDGVLDRVLSNTDRKLILEKDTTNGLLPLVSKLFLDPAIPRKAVAFVGDGNSAVAGRICADTALTLARSVSGSVCILSATGGHSDVAQRLQVRNSTGLLSTRFGPKPLMDFAQPLSRPNLWGIARGEMEDASDERHLRLEAMYLALREVCATFDHTFIEAPTVCPLAETAPIDRLAWALRDICLVRRPFDLFWLPVSGSGSQELRRLWSVLSERRFGSGAIVLSGANGSSAPGEVGIQIAEQFAHSVAGKVCFVDANLRSPRLDRHFRINGKNGLLQAVGQRSSVKEAAQRLEPSNLWFLDVGLALDGLGMKEIRDRLELVFDEAIAEFTYVLVEAPAFNTSLGTLTLGHLTDGVVLVLEANDTRREAARSAKQTLTGAGIPVLGAVLTGLETSSRNNVREWQF